MRILHRSWIRRVTARIAATFLGVALLPVSVVLAAPPKVPANFGATSPLVGTVDVTWNDVIGETSYELFWGPFPPGPTMTITLDANTTSYTFTSLPSGVSHHFQVRACNADGCGPYTGVVGRTPDGSTGIPPIPTNVVVRSTHAGTNVVTWDDVFNETSYEVLWGPFPPGPTMTDPRPANTLFAVYSGLGSGTSYHFQVRACNAAGCSAYSDVTGQTPDGSYECSLTQNAWYANGWATISYVLGANVPTTWRVWAVGSFGSVQILSLSLPAFSPAPTGDLTFGFPASGVVGFLSTLTTPSGGIRCSAFETVETGSPSGRTVGSTPIPFQDPDDPWK
jgi:hypothetical protein